MTDRIALIKRNLSRMDAAGASDADLDAYLADEGFKSADEWRAASSMQTPFMTPNQAKPVPDLKDVPGKFIRNFAPDFAHLVGETAGGIVDAGVAAATRPARITNGELTGFMPDMVRGVGRLGAGLFSKMQPDPGVVQTQNLVNNKIPLGAGMPTSMPRPMPPPGFGHNEAVPQALQPMVDAKAIREAPLDALVDSATKGLRSWDAIKTNLAEKPAHALMDVATLATAGGATAPLLPGRAGTVMQAIGNAAPYIDPLSAAGKLAVRMRNGLGHTASLVTGVTTGTSPRIVEQAFNEGVEGGARGENFRRHMQQGPAVLNEMVDQGMAGERTLRQAASANYEHGMAPLRADPTVLSLAPTARAYIGGRQSVHSPAGAPEVKAAELADIDLLGAAIHQRTLNPFTVAEAVSLGKALRNDYVTNLAHRNAKRVNKEVTSALDETINAHNPEYGRVNTRFEGEKNVIDQMVHELSLAPEKLKYGAASRKIGRAFSADATTGTKAELVAALEAAGADLLPGSIAGQALHSYAPRGLARYASPAAIGGALTGGTVAAGPAVALAAPLLAIASPRVVGNISHTLGRGLGGLREAGGEIGLTGTRARIAGEAMNAVNEHGLVEALRQYNEKRAGGR